MKILRILLTLLILILISGIASAGISACGNVNVSDVLTQNLTSATNCCLLITGHNVSIDLMGYSITDTYYSGYNINNNGYNGLEVFNGTLIMATGDSKGVFIIANSGIGYANNTNIHDIIQKNYGSGVGTKNIIFFSNALQLKGSTNLTFRNITNADPFVTASTPAAIYLQGTNGVLIDNLITHSDGVTFPIRFVTANSNGNITITNSWLKSFGNMPGLDLEDTHVDHVIIKNTTIKRDAGTAETLLSWSHFWATNLTITEDAGAQGIEINTGSVNVTVINSSIVTSGSLAYKIGLSTTDISFINTNFTGSRIIYVNGSFNYSDDGTVWSNTTINTGTFTRNITSWTNTNMTWNELTSVSTATMNYDISGLKPSTNYGFYIDGTLNTSLSTDSAGVLARLTKPTSSVNQLVSVQELSTIGNVSISDTDFNEIIENTVISVDSITTPYFDNVQVGITTGGTETKYGMVNNSGLWQYTFTSSAGSYTVSSIVSRNGTSVIETKTVSIPFIIRATQGTGGGNPPAAVTSTPNPTVTPTLTPTPIPTPTPLINTSALLGTGEPIKLGTEGFSYALVCGLIMILYGLFRKQSSDNFIYGGGIITLMSAYSLGWVVF